MCERCISVSAAYFLLVTLVLTSAFNLNWNYAPVYNDISAGSYFGYTVAFRRDNTQYKLLVGAPKGKPKKTDKDFSKQEGLEEPGVVFQCNLNSGWGCNLLKMDTSGNKEEYIPYKITHKKDRSMFGGAMVVSDDERRTVVCAPKWKNSQYSGFFLLNGICYYSDNPDDSTATQYLKPLINTRLQSARDTKTNEDIFNYAYGEAGFTVHFPKNSSDLIIGAPGVFDWKGAVIKYKGDKFDYERQINIFPTNVYEGNVQIPSFMDLNELDRNNYLGYALDSGIFSRSFNKNETSYVSSAPRGSLYKGKVFIFDFPTPDGENVIKIRNILEGQQMGEYFGASLCVADINGDGLDDLIVGAPQHSLRSLNAAQIIGDEGSIYVYINEDFGNMREVTGDNKIMGRRKSGARFGTAVANVGDLNYDGAHDIAVGAPYEDNGVIYIYHGKRSGSVHLERVQIIEAKNINPLIKGLGFSFSKGLDIDGNRYRDIAAGAYESGHAVILRGHPIITFTSMLTSNEKRISNISNTFTLTACLSYDAKFPPQNVDVKIGIKVDTIYGRARIENSDDSVKNYNETLTKNKNTCKTIKINIKGENKDASKPVDVVMTYDLQFDPADQKPILPNRPDNFCKDCPVVDISQSKSRIIKVPFETGCRTLICKPDLEVNAKFPGVKDKLILGENRTLEMLVEVLNKGEPAYLPQVMIVLPMYTPLVRYPQNCQNVPDVKRPEKHILSCDVGNSLSGNKTIKLQMDIKDVPTRITELVYELNATSSGEEATPDDNVKFVKLAVDVLFDLTITGVSSREQIEYISQNNSILKDLDVIHKFEVWNNGPSRVDVAIIKFEIPYYYYIGTKAITIIQIHKEKTKLYGKSELLRCELDSKFSYFLVNNSNNIENVNITGNIEPQETFDKTSEEPVIPTFRRKRSVEHKEQYVKITPQIPQNKTLFINCGSGRIECARITCQGGPFYDINDRAIIEIPLTFFNISSLGNEIDSKDLILLSTKGSVVSYEPSQNKQPEGHRPDEVVVQTMFLGKMSVSDGGIPSWIIAVAIICGLLILCLIAMGLHKMGFFKREKKDELEKLKEEADEEADE